MTFDDLSSAIQTGWVTSVNAVGAGLHEAAVLGSTAWNAVVNFVTAPSTKAEVEQLASSTETEVTTLAHEFHDGVTHFQDGVNHVLVAEPQLT